MTPFVKKGAFLVLALLLKIFNVFYQHYFIKFYIKNPKRCLPITNPSLLKTASQLSEEIRNRKISSESVVMEDRFEIAIREAKNVDISLMAPNLNLDEVKINAPLLGVPITIKESIAVENLSNTGDVTGLKVNTPEYCLSLETHNQISGTTYNPYDTRRT
ncbi:hypothetical protein PPYR_13739 [Photinus pyralis]|uniref:Uncharacterized protein n=1 Tax=Photinus pyralis TaxID=7054 RepID=A0A5N4AA05_PHOPY|nr:hypothetical protein PPYR_13739 [Photinus pyralis]